MYSKNPYYDEALEEENLRFKARIRMNDRTLTNESIKSIKYDLNINDNEKFSIGGAHGATVVVTLLNFENELDNIKFENKDFKIDIKLALEDLYTVAQFNEELVQIINTLKIKHITSLWIPQGVFYATEVKRNENKTITIKMQDKTKYLEEEYICNLPTPFKLKQLYNDIHRYFQIISDTTTFYNDNVTINKVPKGYTGKELLGYIAECACGFYFINRSGNGEIRQYGTESVKSISKGCYSRFVPAENYINIQKMKYGGNNIIGADRGYMLEISDKNPFVTDTVAQNILLKMQGFTYITYDYKASVSDIAMDVGDMFDITNRNNVKYLTYIMGNSWEFNGSVTQNWTAKGESEINNTYSRKGPINKQLENINNELSDISNDQIPSVYEKAVEKATELLTEFNGGYVIKKEGELYISDNEDIDKAQHIWRWNINGLGYSSTGINGPYGTAITMNGEIVADFITAGTMNADRINGGTFKVGGINNKNGKIEVVDSSGNVLVTIGVEGINLGNGTKIVGADGLKNTYIYKERSNVGFGMDQYYSLTKKNLVIDFPVPDNFVITKAYVRIMHSPCYWSYADTSSQSTKYTWGYSRNVKLYKCTNLDTRMIASDFGGAIWSDDDFSQYSEVSNAFGSNGFTAKVPSNTSYNAEIVTSIDISSVLEIGKINRLKIATTNSVPSSNNNAAAQTGEVQAVVLIEGFIKS